MVPGRFVGNQEVIRTEPESELKIPSEFTVCKAPN